jgi:predicted ArsR family transcriptional regulator
MERADELEAYRSAKVHMFYLPGEATRDHLKRLVETYLSDIITYASERTPEVWKITDRGVERFRPRAPKSRTKRG